MLQCSLTSYRSRKSMSSPLDEKQERAFLLRLQAAASGAAFREKETLHGLPLSSSGELLRVRREIKLVDDYIDILGDYMPRCHFFSTLEVVKFLLQIFFPFLQDNHWMLLVHDVRHHANMRDKSLAEKEKNSNDSEESEGDKGSEVKPDEEYPSGEFVFEMFGAWMKW
ncbi:hypothetical protein RHSIM_Rhsim03G0020500 [Rhododendron simsii]|uniref:Uncharacterized protein n=1 Tax=Rhododendron simsii TaxID=118357 RepID=A0A834H5G8_RHOSS|nr:hypothetical protein RHSIM_Rhsim03G0020500 [Rhododendron simsii]